MQTSLYPNRLRQLIRGAGYKMREFSNETGIPESTLYDWAKGNRIIPLEERMKIATLLRCESSDLAPFVSSIERAEQREKSTFALNAPVRVSYITTLEGKISVGHQYGKEINTSHTSDNLYALASQNASRLMQQADVDCFAVDDLIVFEQSNAFTGWSREDIILTKLPTPLSTLVDIEALRQKKLPLIQHRFVNSSHYRLAAYTPAFSDRLGLEVTLAPIGFHDYYTLIPFLDEPLLINADGTPTSIREKYGYTSLAQGSEGNYLVPSPVSLQCVIVTKDNQIILTQRSNSVAFYPLHWSASFEETMDAPGLSPKGEIRAGDADFFACAMRGLEEEFGVPSEAIMSMKMLSLNVEYLILAIGVVAVINVNLTAQEVKHHWMVKAPDKNEASKLDAIALDLSSVIEKLFSNNILWHPTSRGRLIQLLFHRYGIDAVDKTIASRA